MPTEGIINVDEALSSCPAANSNPSSPRNRVKFLCSHGGKILPRPGDGHLKYVGGETRVISVPRDITFPDLMKKLTCLIDGEMVLKYQLMPEELDALVSVKSDEDLRHMFTECEQFHGSARLRAFLFPAAPVVLENTGGTLEPHALEQRYIDAINGIIRITPANIKHHHHHHPTRQGSLVSSACSSPRSPESYIAETIMNNETMMVWGNYHNPRSHLHKVRSTPNICSLNINVVQQNTSSHGHHHSPSNYHSYRQPHHHPPCYQHTIPPVDPSAPERLISVRSTGRVADHASHHHYSISRQNYSCNKCVHFEEYYDRCSERRMIDRSVSIAMSPLILSPRPAWNQSDEGMG